MGAARQETVRRRLGAATLFAALLHVQVVALVLLAAYRFAPRNWQMTAASGEDAIGVTTVDDETAREIMAELDKQEQQQKAEEAKKEEESPTTPGQVVEMPTPREERRPDRARFVAEHDSAVEKETQRRGPPGEAPRPAAPTPPLMAMRAPAASTRGQPPSPAGSAGPPSPPSSLSGQSPETESGPPPGPTERPAAGGPPTAPGDSAQSRPPAPSALALMPSEQTLSRALGTGGTPDYLEDVDDGPETALNAKKWKFASFFNRVKEQIRQHWHAAQEVERRDPTGTLYGGKPCFTVLRVQLRPNGQLSGVSILKASGVDFLDDVAIQAVKEAQPFPNPPAALVDRTGFINFRFGFVVESDGEPHLKVFRYSSL